MSAMRSGLSDRRLVRFSGNGEAHPQNLFQTVDAELFTSHSDIAQQVFPAHAFVMPASFYLKTSKCLVRARNDEALTHNG